MGGRLILRKNTDLLVGFGQRIVGATVLEVTYRRSGAMSCVPPGPLSPACSAMVQQFRTMPPATRGWAVTERAQREWLSSQDRIRRRGRAGRRGG